MFVKPLTQLGGMDFFLRGVLGGILNLIESVPEVFLPTLFYKMLKYGISGVKQGDILSLILYNLFVDDLVNELKSYPSDPVIINGLSINYLLYADDIILLANTQDWLQSYLNVPDKF